MAMKKVVLFKSESDDYKQAFGDNNYETLFVEPLQFIYINQNQLCEILKQKDYNGLILTSPRAVEALSKCWDPSKFVIWNTKKVYTVGSASCYKIKCELGLDAIGMSSGNAENLAQIIKKENPEASKFLFPCGNLSSEILPNLLQTKGITVDCLTVYETKENEELKTNLMKVNDCIEDICCLIFFSPSGCEYVHRELQTFNSGLKALPHFAIGNSTAHRIENLGTEIAGVAAQPKAESIVDSVKSYFADKCS